MYSFICSTNSLILRLLLLAILSYGCSPKNESKNDNEKSSPNHLAFQVHTASQTGLQFANILKPTAELNMFNYMYFYNGAGVGAGDLNNDGLVDLFFAANQQPSKLFLNKGNLQFEDITAQAGIPNDGAWSTGVSITDINNDGLLDIYVCRASNYETLKGSNILLVCKGLKNGIPFYAEEAATYGIQFSGLSTHAVFFDYDSDNDLDMFLLNHAPSHVGRFAERSKYLGTYDSITGDRLYRRDGDQFVDVTKNAGINSNAIGYGLGVVVSDINLDGRPDIYVGNDFHENDYLYINNGNGTFTDQTQFRTLHTSQFTMGVDAADANNDGHPEILSMDMLPEDHYMQKRSLGEDNYDIFQMKLRYGYHPFSTRNNLQLNRRNGFFSEIGLYAGVAATDWSWSCLWSDFDNDGWKDIFISNGIPKRLNDIDWVNFISDEKMQQKLALKQLTETDFEVINQFPEIKLPNYFFRNNGQASFSNENHTVSNNMATFSNGAAYADFDNDGDMDLVVNNIADNAMLYENKLGQIARQQSASVVLKGPEGNTAAWGTTLLLFCGQEIRSYQHQSVHGYMSSMHIPMHIGLANTRIDSAFLLWPDGGHQKIVLDTGSQVFTWAPQSPKFEYAKLRNFYAPKSFPVVDLTAASGLHFEHTENLFQEFNREQLIPHMTSTEGPALAVGDVNGDNLDDVFIGSARGFTNALFVQQPNGRFIQSKQPALAADSNYEDVDACFADVNNDGAADLLVASGGNEFYGESPYTQPRLYLNNGKGSFTRKSDAFGPLHLVGSCMAAADFNKDGFADLFVGARSVPFAYGLPAKQYLLQNDGTGRFVDVTSQLAPSLQNAGMVKHAVWTDLDANGSADLLLSFDWGPVSVWLNTGKPWQLSTLSPNGWWNFALPLDADGNGSIDVLAGNHGLNSRLKASEKEPIKLFISDFDGNGTTEQLLTYFVQGKEEVFAGKDELQKQMPGLKKQFLYAEDFAKAAITDIIPASKLKAAHQLSASQLSSSLLLQTKGQRFSVQPLPWMAQLSSYSDALVVQANADNLPDVLLIGNFYDNTIQMGRNDADFGLLLLNKGGGQFECELLNGAMLYGESRKVRAIKLGGKQAFIVARNNAAAMVLAFQR